MMLRHRVTLAGLLALFVSGWGQVAHAQDGTGRISGKVVDSETAMGLSNAQVAIPDLNLMTLTDLEGRFFFNNVPAGQHDVRINLLGYAPKIVADAVITAGSTTALDVLMEQTAIEVEAITVTAQMEAGATAALLDKQKNARSVTEAIGQQEISRSPDSDAAEVATRVSGVTVTEGRYVYIRGLGERYSQTSINGSPVPSPEPEREVVPLDLFPAEFLESLSTQKTYTPDRPGEFSGGSVDITNREFPDRLSWKMSVGTSVNTISQFQSGFLNYRGGGTDGLGIDDGSRAIPEPVTVAGYGLGGNRLPSDDPNVTLGAGVEFANQLNQFSPTENNTPGNLDLGGSIGNRTTLFGNDLGFFLAANYTTQSLIRDDEREVKWRAAAFDPEFADQSRPNVDYQFRRGMNRVTLGGVANFSYLLTPSNQFSLQTLYNRNTSDESRLLFGDNREDLGSETYGERLRFQERDLIWGQLSGKHELLSLNSRIDWRVSAARARRDEPGLRETVYTRGFNTTDPFFLDNNTGESGRYFYTDLVDDDLSGALDWSWNFGAWDNPSTLKVGGAIRSRDRDFAARRYRWNFRSGITSLDSVIANGTIVGGDPKNNMELQLRDLVENGDQYVADESTYGAYGMFDIPVGSRLRVIVGARVEWYDLELTSPVQAQLETLTDLKQTDVLPSLSLNYRLNPTMNLRLAGSRTVDRPEFRELAPFQFTEASSLRQLRGNPSLQIADITSADAKWEWFPNAGEVLSVGAFYKYLTNPIEQVFFAAASSLYSYQNAESAYLYGAELTVRKRLDYGRFWSHFTLGAGFSVTQSNVTVLPGDGFNPTNLSRALQGQSPFTVNANLVWLSTQGGTELGAYYGVFGRRIEAAGGSGVPDITEDPRHVLDLTWRQNLRGHLSLKLKVQNLLDSPYRRSQEANGIERVQREYTVGQSISLALTYGN
ncbi:MAG: TonB-dependent receptor [marine benthic group bacterium]|nr:TonB-dependent receptor [Candidatus Benthicola marisminoris]